MTIDIESLIVYDLQGKCNQIESYVSSMQCQAMNAPAFLNVGGQINDMANTVRNAETNIRSDVSRLEQLLDDSIKELQNNDRYNDVDVRAADKSFLSDIFGSIVNFFIPSASAETGISILPPMNCKVGVVDMAFCAKLLGQGQQSEIYLDGFKYDLSTHILDYGTGTVKVDYYVPLTVKLLPEDEETAGEIPLSLSTMDLTVVLSGHHEVSVTEKEMLTLESGDLLVVPYKEKMPEGGKSFADQHEDVYQAALFARKLMSLDEHEYDVKNNIIGFSSGGGSALAIYGEHSDFFNGTPVSVDYAPFSQGNGRGSANDQYTSDSLKQLRDGLKANGDENDNKKVQFWYLSSGENSENMDNFSQKLGYEYCEREDFKGGHSPETFLKVLQSYLSTKPNNKKEDTQL